MLALQIIDQSAQPNHLGGLLLHYGMVGSNFWPPRGYPMNQPLSDVMYQTTRWVLEQPEPKLDRSNVVLRLGAICPSSHLVQRDQFVAGLLATECRSEHRWQD